MAEIIPDRLPTRASRGEQRLFSLLQKLPDDHIVYYEPVVENRHPDFLIIMPEHGLLIIEVKGWYPKDIKAADHNHVVIEVGGAAAQCLHPLRQARDYMFKLMDYCRRHREFQTLINTSGEHQGRFVFPFGNFAILSNISAEQRQQHPLGDLTPLFPVDRVVSRDILLDWDALSAEVFLDKLCTFFDPRWDFPRLTEKQIDTLRAIIHPEITLELAKNSQQTELKVLDLKQERNARNIGEGHRVLYGVAGSGKTVLLIARARLLAHSHPDRRILFLCFNVSLAAYLKQRLNDCDNITVSHFDAWAKANGTTRRQGESNDALGTRLLAILSEGYGDGRTYASVLVDEAQDFSPNWFQCLLAAMTDPNDGDLMIVGDGSQGLYSGNKKVSWSQLGIQARGRTVHKDLDLNKNYRNTREILELAKVFSEATGAQEAEGILSVTVRPENSQRSTGQQPVLLEADNRAEECIAIVNLVRSLLNGTHRYKGISDDLQPSDIGILYPRLMRQDKDTFTTFACHLKTIAPTLWLNENQGTRRLIANPGIKIQTIHSAKGLQYAVVILMWTDLLPASFDGTDQQAERRLLYVALTRPEDLLIITHSRDSAFIREIKDSRRTMGVHQGQIIDKPME